MHQITILRKGRDYRGTVCIEGDPRKLIAVWHNEFWVRTQAHAEQATARDTVALAVSATTSSDVSASSSPQLLVSSSTVPPAAPPPATGASNGLPGASPHSTRTSPASSRPPSASPLPAPVPASVSWSMTGPSAVSSRSQSLPSSSASTPATTKATATVAPLPVAPQQAPASRPGVTQVVSASPSPRTSGAPRLIQPKQPQILPKLSSGSANMTTPSAAATTRSQSPRAAQHKATPRPAPVPAPQPATTVQRGAAMGLNTGSTLLIGNPAAAQPGMFPAGPAHGIFLLNQYIPGLGHSPILIQGALGQTQSSLGQIQGVQLALRPPHATGLTLGPQTGPRPHPGPPGTPTLVIPQNLGLRPNIFLAPPRMMSPPLVCHSPGTATDAPTAAGHAAHADHAGPAHTGGWDSVAIAHKVKRLYGHSWGGRRGRCAETSPSHCLGTEGRRSPRPRSSYAGRLQALTWDGRSRRQQEP
ncbi:hypothetical protein MRX96_045314 [Rhipicephalus microplus]